MTKAACGHYGVCGGCSLQHLSDAEYYDFKGKILSDIVAELGASAELIKPLIKIGEGSRRRAVFKVAMQKGKAQIGFYQAKTHDVVDLEMCPVSDALLVKILPKLRELLETLKKPSNIKELSLTIMANGLDAGFILREKLTDSDQQKISNFAKENNIVRLALKEKEIVPIYGNSEAIVQFLNVAVNPPIGSFLQATEKGEQAITQIILQEVAAEKNIVDLFSGCGTYSLPLAAQDKNVTAYEGEKQMVMEIYNAALRAGFDKKISAQQRDLFKTPLAVEELNKFDAIVINPPRLGAKSQAQKIAQSNVKKVILVSCNPITFQRDAKILLAGGYQLESAVAIDQFYWNQYLEIIGIFKR
jgi:23S rRNA (uracil1939-C5)-methyltransferase